MRRVLFIHYHFLPVHNVAVKRLVGYAKQLPALGWQPLVLTRVWQGLDEADPSWGLSWEPDLERNLPCTIHRTPPVRPSKPKLPSPARTPGRDCLRPAAKLAAKVSRLTRMLRGDYPDEFVGWVESAVAAGVELSRTQPLDVVMSYCPPETNHVVAHRLARRLDVPWVPFFGDLYGFIDTGLPAYSVERLLRRAWHQWCLAPAAACAAVSPGMVGYLARTYRKRVELVLTGYDPEEFNAPVARPASPRDRLVVSHVGSLYPNVQRPDLFFDGLDRLLTEHPEIVPQLEVRFVGSKHDAGLRAMIEGRPAARVCRIEPKVGSRVASSIVQDSDALLAFTVVRNGHRTMSYPTKIFEAFGAKRPVLSVPADGDWVDALLTRTDGGVSARSADDVTAVLWDWFSSWRRDGRVPWLGNRAEIAALSRRRQVERLVQLFESVRRPAMP